MLAKDGNGTADFENRNAVSTLKGVGELVSSNSLALCSGRLEVTPTLTNPGIDSLVMTYTQPVSIMV